MKVLEEGKVDVARLVEDKYPLRDLPAVMDEAESKLKVLIDPTV